MIFKSITLDNLFSYHGPTRFDLAPAPGDQGNIAVIMGRNGHGKTSFLNSVKLLFGGVTKELREAVQVQRDRGLQEKGFVLGDRDWWGILNHKARAAGDKRCAISAVLLDDNGQEIEVVRSWDLSNSNYRSKLQISAPRKPPLESDVAQQYLSQLLPLDYIPFFFFDAEEVGYLAEANRSQTIEKMELLLNIRPADNLRDSLKEIRSNWSQQALDRNAQLDLMKAENRRNELRMQLDGWLQEKEDVAAEVENIQDDLRQTEQKIGLLRGTGSIESTARLETEKTKESERLAEALSALSAAFEHDAFLRLNAPLAHQAFLAAQGCAASQSNTISELLQSLKDPLKNIFVSPPYPPDSRLTEAQVRFYQARVVKLLDASDVAPEAENLFRMDTGQAQKLANLLTVYQSQRLPEETLREHMERALAADKALVAADSELQSVSQLSEDNKLRLKQLDHDRQRLENTRRDKQDRLRDIENELKTAKREITIQEDLIGQLQGRAKNSALARSRVALLDNMLGLLEAYKQQVKQQKRAALERAFNKHLARLLDSNALIHNVHIDEDFLLSYHDQAGAEVPMSSLSAGMKQLAATALLWALKDASERRLPVIIDTPLGRIDRQHQENLLTRYYPQAGAQVILLPTDSELDERKHRILAPHIYREFHLHNPTGEDTRVETLEI